MSRFLSELVTARAADSDGGSVVLREQLVYQSDVLGKTIIVPAGFKTDYASVPRLPLAYLLFGGVGDEPAVVHDYLYSKGQVSRKTADAVFREALQVCGVGGLRRWPMWLGVRLFGASHYSNVSPSTADAA